MWQHIPLRTSICCDFNRYKINVLRFTPHYSKLLHAIMKLLCLLLLAVALTASGNIISPNKKIQPYLIRLRIELLTTTLQEKCPHLLKHDKFTGKRDAL